MTSLLETLDNNETADLISWDAVFLGLCVQKVWEGSLDEHNASNAWASVWKNKMKTSNSVSSNSNIPD